MSNKWHNEWNKSILLSNERSSKGYDEMYDYVQNSTAIYKGSPVDFLYGAKWFDQQEIDDIKYKSELMYSVLSKVINHYKLDSDYRKIFPFNQELEDLILVDHGYENPLPIARIDFFYDEATKSMRWCEFNADGTSAMNEDRELVNGLTSSSTYQSFQEGKEAYSFELFDTWIDAMTEIYSDFSQGKELRRVAIVDFLEKGSPNEFKIFQERMKNKGIECEIADIRELVFKDDKLFANGVDVDVVYRRAVTSDMMDHSNEIVDFIRMIKSQKVCLIGPISTQIIHHKLIFSILHDQRTLMFLTDEEADFVKSSIPRTVVFDNLSTPLLDEIKANKDSWIVKPFDRYGSKGVVAGVDVSQNEWMDTLQSITGQDYLAQEFCTPYTHEYPVQVNKKWEMRRFGNITGAFMYRGKFAGILSRTGPNGVISGINGGYSQPTIVIK